MKHCEFSGARTRRWSRSSGDEMNNTSSNLTAHEAARRIGAGELTSEQLVRDCLEVIAEQEQHVQAWQFLDAEHALQQARAADAKQRSGAALGPLHGVPVGIKDIIDTHDMPTESGTAHHAGRRPERDAHCVSALRAAGAVILGKTVTTELAALAPSKSRNPVNHAHTPGGSSAGSGAAVGGNMVPLALGTQTGGSVIRPASFCGTYALKPTLGMISRVGVTLQSHTLDTVGVYGRSLDDLALISGALDLHDPSDDVSYARARSDVANALSDTAMAAPKIAFWKTPNWHVADEAARDAITGFAGKLGDACTPIELRGAIDCISQDHQCIQAAENAYHYGPLYDKDKALLSDLLRARLEDAFQVDARHYLGALQRREQHYNEIASVLETHDAVLCLSSAGPAPKSHDTTGNPIFNGLWTYLGVPCVTMPLLEVEGMPLGVQLVGRRREEAKLLRVARWVEEAAQ